MCCPARKVGHEKSGDSICVPPSGKTVPFGVADYEKFYYKCSSA